MEDGRIASGTDFAAQVARIPVMLDRARMAYLDGDTFGHPTLAGRGAVTRGATTQDEEDDSTVAGTMGASVGPGTAVDTAAKR